MGLFKDSPPKPPDYGPLIKASAAAATASTKLAQEQFAWAKEAYAADKTISDQVTSAFLENMQLASDNAAKDRARYESTFQPLEDSLVADAQSYASPERKAQEMGRAQAGVAQQFEAKRQAATAELESYGINPSATRFAALDLGYRQAQGAAEAAAADAASRAVDDRAIALRASAIDLGRGYPTSVNQSIGTSGQAGGGASGTALNQTASGANTMGTGLGWNTAAGNSLGQQGGFMNSQYAAQLDYTTAKNAANPLSAIAGLAAGIGTKYLTGGFGTGGAVPNPGGPAGTPWSYGTFGYSPGGSVKPKTSPSGGAIPDDVPARLTPGEFVVPTDVAAWKGEEFFQKLIESSRMKRGEAKAVPKPTHALPQTATFQSRPMAAVPVQ